MAAVAAGRTLARSLQRCGARRASGCAVRAMSSSSTDVVKAVETKIQGSKVLVYEKWGCPFCARVKDTLEDLALEPEPEFVEISGAGGAATQRALAQLTGQRTVPNVFVGGVHVGGCDDTMAALRSGRLQQLLSKAGVTSAADTAKM